MIDSPHQHQHIHRRFKMSDHLYSNVPDSQKFLTADQISFPSSDILNNLDITYVLNVYPYTRYISNGRYLITQNPSPHRRYFFHGCAALQTNQDSKFKDMVAGNHGVFGANLSVANAWANYAGGYISTADPAGGATDSVIRIPGPNYDYLAGEGLLLFWAGQITPEGADSSIMGTSHGTSANGLRIRCSTTGRLSFALHDTAPTSLFSISTTDTVAGKPFVSGEYHTFAVWINGATRKCSFWVDGVINIDDQIISSSNPCNTLSSGTWNIGAASQSGGTTEGTAVKTYAFAGLKFPATDVLPVPSDITAIAFAFNNDPSKLILNGAI